MAAPKPISLTVGDNPTPGTDPQPFVVVGDIPGAVDFTAIAGYDADETQTLKNVEGVLTWVTDPAE